MTKKDEIKFLKHINQKKQLNHQECATYLHTLNPEYDFIDFTFDGYIKLISTPVWKDGYRINEDFDVYTLTDKGIDLLHKHKEVTIDKMFPRVISVIALIVSIAAMIVSIIT